MRRLYRGLDYTDSMLIGLLLAELGLLLAERGTVLEKLPDSAKDYCTVV